MIVFKLIKPAAFAVALLWSFASYGQNNFTIPLGILPMQYNSSFAGESDGPRLNTAFGYSLHGRNSLTFKGQDFGYLASYDQFIPALRSGIGVSLSRHANSFFLVTQQ